MLSLKGTASDTHTHTLKLYDKWNAATCSQRPFRSFSTQNVRAQKIIIAIRHKKILLSKPLGCAYLHLAISIEVHKIHKHMLRFACSVVGKNENIFLKW